MGAVTFSIDRKLVRHLKKLLPLKLFVETGTFKGDSIRQVEDLFSKIFSCEISEFYYKQALVEFDELSHIEITHQSSADLIPSISKFFEQESEALLGLR